MTTSIALTRISNKMSFKSNFPAAIHYANIFSSDKISLEITKYIIIKMSIKRV